MNTTTQTKNINPKTVARLVTKMKLTNEDIEQLLIDKYKDLLFQEALKEEEARIKKEAQIKEREAERNRIFPKSLTPPRIKSRSPPRRNNRLIRR
jgi:hypothetical protein